MMGWKLKLVCSVLCFESWKWTIPVVCFCVYQVPSSPEQRPTHQDAEYFENKKASRRREPPPPAPVLEDDEGETDLDLQLQALVRLVEHSMGLQKWRIHGNTREIIKTGHYG